MRQFRTNLTRLKSLMEQKLPGDSDIFGYPGVTKDVLLRAVTTSYDLSHEIKESEESRYEVISLKRAGSCLYESLKQYLEADVSEKERARRFNDFLDNLSLLTDKTLITYFIVAKNGIRDDTELAGIRTRIADLTTLSSELSEKKDTVVAQEESISAAIEAINTGHETTSKYSTEMQRWHETTNAQFSKIVETHGAIAGWDEDIKNRKQQYDTQKEQIDELVKETTKSRDDLDAYVELQEEHSKRIKDSDHQHRQLLDEIRQTLEGANRVGMAASFSERKRELRISQAIWQVVFLCAIAATVGAVAWFVLPTLTAETTQWTKLAIELGIVSPLIWLGWFAARQYGYISRIREDYAFKSAAAMAYEGHKKAAREGSQELEQVLLEFSLFNMSQNPIRLYGKGEVDGSPFHELASKLLEKLPSFKKVSMTTPVGAALHGSTDESDSNAKD